MFSACDQAFINTSVWLHQSSKYINTSIYSYGCGQAHLGMPKEISNIKFALRLNKLMMLIFCFWVDIHKNSKLIQLFQAVEQFDSWVLVPISVCQLDCLILLRKISPEWIDLSASLLQDSSASCWVLGFFVGDPWRQARFFLFFDEPQWEQGISACLCCVSEPITGTEFNGSDKQCTGGSGGRGWCWKSFQLSRGEALKKLFFTAILTPLAFYFNS